jgi:hypothetical protein
MATGGTERNRPNTTSQRGRRQTGPPPEPAANGRVSAESVLKARKEEHEYHLAELSAQHQFELEKLRHERQVMLTLTIGVLGSVVLLCWLFLWYGKPELTANIVTLVVGLAGGVGLGRHVAHLKK